MPHPLYPITAQTFIAVAVLDKPVAWTEDQKVRIVLLVSTEMNNPKAFQLWPYLSSLISVSRTFFNCRLFCMRESSGTK